MVCAISSCRKSPVAPDARQDQPRQESFALSHADARHPPTSDDLSYFLRGTLPPALKLLELKTDPPVLLPGTASGGNAWLYNVRVTFGPTEDLLGPADSKEAAAFQSVLAELSALTAWSQAYAQSPYATRYPGFTVEPVYAAPKLLRIVHAMDKPSPPLYGKMSAEWQVDHWNYAVVSLQMSADDHEGAGKLRSQYTRPILIQGSPEAVRFMAQAQASLDAVRPKKAAIEAAYQADLLKDTQPGTLYRGQLRHQGKVTVAEVRFVALPTGADQQDVQLEVRLPDAGDESFTYLAQRSERLPLSMSTSTMNAVRGAKKLPMALSTPTEDAGEATDDDEAPALQKAPALTGDLKLRLVKASGKQTYNGTVPDALLQITRTNAQPASVTLQLRDGHLEGRLNGASTEASGFVLSVQRSP